MTATIDPGKLTTTQAARIAQCTPRAILYQIECNRYQAEPDGRYRYLINADSFYQFLEKTKSQKRCRKRLA